MSTALVLRSLRRCPCWWFFLWLPF